jgi:hypothetical protein
MQHCNIDAWFAIVGRTTEDRLFQLDQYLDTKRLQVTQVSVLLATALSHQQ